MASSSLAEQINAIGVQITDLRADLHKASERYDDAATRYREYEAKHEGSSDMKVNETLKKLEREKESYQKEKEDLRRLWELYMKKEEDLRRELQQQQQHQQQGGQIIITTSSHISFYTSICYLLPISHFPPLTMCLYYFIAVTLVL